MTNSMKESDMDNNEKQGGELKACREAFEKWAENTPRNKWFNAADTKDGYVDGVTNVAFQAWQAALASSQGEGAKNGKI